MPYGRYPERVKDFTRWSRDMIAKSKISNSATGGSFRYSRTRRRGRRRRKKNATTS